jgi:PAS domain S-box-containing protein
MMNEPIKKKKILVVDNHSLVLMWMKGLLKNEGHSVLTAEDGLSALAILKTYIPDIIFTDLIMPNIDGKKLCQIIRKIPELKDVYIVILSAASIEEIERLTGYGANVCISKGPFSKMAPHILKVVDEADRKTSEDPKEKIIGSKDVQPRQITKELLSIKNHFETIMESLSECILEINPDLKIVYINPAAISLIGLSEERLLGSNFIELLQEKDRPRVKGFLSTIDKSPKKIGEDSPLTLNGKEVLLTIIPIQHDDYLSTIILLNNTNEHKKDGYVEGS